ncbi:hypothetical protein [Pontibacillus litoralis]|uniref:Uncharacterized protein n=1 Tax=Pontibacillus litoralis JSM 072002 TaxID=1385512 RepID=A0A0A5G1S8_9BACI|nr:hypothetical protein [Pontibacillus litoralis]KGX87041.1 hypothetical protein N784_02680 [Pontibacillus litoralis JSM 072002]
MAKSKKSVFKKWWFWALMVIVLIAVSPGYSETESEQADEQQTNEGKAQTEEKSQKEEKQPEQEQQPKQETTDKEQQSKKPEKPTYASGMYEVGSDIEPGLYQSSGSVIYWERLAGFSGEFDDIIANGNPQGQEYVQIKQSDAAFTSQGSGEWTKVEEDYNPKPKTTFGDGTYLVGKDIEPGRYKSSTGDGLGYWARLSGFSGELAEIIANGNPSGPTMIEISSSDKGFQTWGNGEWRKVD